ncbi:uncharacterized protein LOC105196768 [Solenopsis invicta]|uniref:uncharacterized protein LOC105196768 n=1 Tax=Solenopsis invicta TaxID=13686 RepID=UPI0005961821|nr:uncharacterized protein LOC105196768 [Solenopsis invicta]
MTLPKNKDNWKINFIVILLTTWIKLFINIHKDAVTYNMTSPTNTSLAIISENEYVIATCYVFIPFPWCSFIFALLNTSTTWYFVLFSMLLSTSTTCFLMFAFTFGYSVLMAVSLCSIIICLIEPILLPLMYIQIIHDLDLIVPWLKQIGCIILDEIELIILALFRLVHHIHAGLNWIVRYYLFTG